jgi:hypothetical protein
MLSYDLAKGHAGPVLIGEYSPLAQLVDVSHDIYKRSGFLHESFLDIIHEIGKASVGRRIVIQPPELCEERGVRYGVETSWPRLLVQARMLRTALMRVDHSKWHQAVTWMLEAVIEDALRDDFKKEAKNIIQRWESLEWGTDLQTDSLSEMCEKYHSLHPQKREANLANLIHAYWYNELDQLV